MTSSRFSSAAPLSFAVISLGCPKNTVDSERLLGDFALKGFLPVADVVDADVVLVNTCGFLAAAREEARETLETVRLRTGGLVVACGCFAERAAGNEAFSEMLSAADRVAGFADYPRLPELCRAWLAERGTKEKETDLRGWKGKKLPQDYLRWLDGGRILSGAPHLAFLKLGEGCGNHCHFCAIPLIRGERVSRPLDAVLQEAGELAASGVKELCLIAQDTTAYGMDLAGGTSLLPELLDRLPDAAPGLRRVRLLYAHPRHVTKEFAEAFARNPLLVPYLDLPLQHATDRMLDKMGRRHGMAQMRSALALLREKVPGIAIRTTFIVGHPGETDEDFAALLRFVEEEKFEAMGAFVYSPEPGTRSAEMPEKVPPEVAEAHRKALYAAQKKVWRARAKARIGQGIEVMLDERTDGGWQAHADFQMPGEDGAVYVEGAKRRKPGDIVRVRVTAARFPDYFAAESRREVRSKE
jgi:ribosomal protein S12 methylthiotransferase